MPINSKRKGDRFERSIAARLRRWWPKAVRQSYDQARDGSACPDIKNTPYWIECKNWKRITTRKAIKFYYDAVSKAGNDKDVILVFKDDCRRRWKQQGLSAIMSNDLIDRLEQSAGYLDHGERQFFEGMNQVSLVRWSYLSALFDYNYFPKSEDCLCEAGGNYETRTT